MLNSKFEALSRCPGRKLLLLAASLLAACAAPLPAQKPVELSIFSINDFHGNIQPKLPTPLMPRLPDAQTGEIKAQAAGGVAHLATALEKLRSQRVNSVFVAAGDLIGASPQAIASA